MKEIFGTETLAARVLAKHLFSPGSSAHVKADPQRKPLSRAEAAACVVRFREQACKAEAAAVPERATWKAGKRPPGKAEAKVKRPAIESSQPARAGSLPAVKTPPLSLS